MRDRMIKSFALLAGSFLLLAQPPAVQARLRLVALPDRDTVVVSLENPDATLVQEERLLTLQEGVNKIDFSWKGVRIDESSIRFESLANDPDALSLLSVSYPPGEDALVWDVHSREAIDAPVRISYLLDGIDQIVTYTAVADRDETALGLRSYMVLRNFSGEDFDRATWLLGYGDPFVSESRHQETKRVLFFAGEEVPVVKEFTWDAAVMPHEPDREADAVGIPVHYVIENTEPSKLGEHMLWPGKARVFQHDGQGTNIFLGEDRADFTPVGDEMRLYIGNSRDIVVTQRRMETRRENIRRNNDRHVILYDEVRRYEVKIENFRDNAAVLNVIQHLEGEWEMVNCTHEYEKLDYKTLKFGIEIAEAAETMLEFTYRVKNTIERAPHTIRRFDAPSR